MPRNAIVLTASLARAAGQDAADRQMRAAGRMAWSDADADLAVSTMNRLLLLVPFEHGGLGGLALSPQQLAGLRLTPADLIMAAA